VYALQHPGLHDLLWPVANEQIWMITLIYIALVGSLMVSYTKARAEGLGLECKTGLLARPERVVILAIGLLFGVCIWALVVIAVFSHVTAIERIVSVWRMTRQPAKSEEAQEAVNIQEAVHAHQIDTSADRHHLSTAGGADGARETPVRPVSTSVPPFSGGV
jgi:CDP-diacylglycerol--glycerol-3-phosphate 3-phosphatidyltransferase